MCFQFSKPFQTSKRSKGNPLYLALVFFDNTGTSHELHVEKVAWAAFGNRLGFRIEPLKVQLKLSKFKFGLLFRNSNLLISLYSRSIESIR